MFGMFQGIGEGVGVGGRVYCLQGWVVSSIQVCLW